MTAKKQQPSYGLSLLLLLLPLASSAQAGDFAPTTAPMTSQRVAHVAVLLLDGRALIVGGRAEFGDPVNVPSPELFDPTTSTFAQTVGPSVVARGVPRVTRLSDGRVLITGGGRRSSVFSSAEIFDPATGISSATGSMITPRVRHTATLLDDGTVLITGGFSGGSVVSSAEIFDPTTETFSSTTGSMTEPRTRHTATLLQDGTVLVAGGRGGIIPLSTAEIFDPTTGTFSSTAGAMTSRRGLDHTATLLQDGTVLLVGGKTSGAGQPSGDIYDPITRTFRKTAHSTSGPRRFHTATLLNDGTVLIAGGIIGVGATLNSTFRADIYEPSTEQFNETAPNHMTTERSFPTATLLDDGTVLITGGVGLQNNLPLTVKSSAEIFTP